MRLSAEHIAAAYDRDARRLLVWLTRRTYDGQLAADLLGETFARAYAARKRFKGEDADDVSRWLFGIARNVLHDAQRKRGAERRALERLGVEPVALNDLEVERIEDLAELGELRTAVTAALAELNAEHRTAVELRVTHELSYAEIAERLQISEQNARARVSRGLRALQVALDGVQR